MGKVSINVEKVIKKLETVTISQDSIQSLSSYLSVFKKYSDKVVETWLSVLRRSSENRRLILFYVANELLQTCRHKNALIFKTSWKKYLPKAVEAMKDTNVATKIERILSIWEERRVYDSAYINELKKTLLRQEYITPVTKTRITDPKKVVEDYSPEAGIEALRKCSIVEEDSKFKLKQLDQSKLDFSNLDAVRKLKDRAHGREFSQLFDESYTALEEYVKSLEAELETRKKMMEILEHAEVFYDNQYHDAAVVADAYYKYGHRVQGMRQRAVDFLDNMPDDDIPSVDVEDAPSPGNTPPHMRVDSNDISAFDRRSLALQEEDMDLSDEDMRTSDHSNRSRLRSIASDKSGGDHYSVPEEDRYSPSGALPSTEAPMEPSSDTAAAAAAMRIVSGYRPPANLVNPILPTHKAQPTRDPRIHGLQLGIPPPPPPPPLGPLGGPPLLPPSLLNAAVALQQNQPPPPPPRTGTPVRDEAPESGNQNNGGPDTEGAGGSTPTQDEPPESSIATEPPTPNTAINFLSNFIQLNTNPTAVTSVVQTQPLSPAVPSIPGLWNSTATPNPPPMPPPPQPPQTQASVAAAVRLLSPQMGTDTTPGIWGNTTPSQPPPPPVPDSETWPRPFHLPPPPPPPTAAVRMAAAAAHAAVQFAAVGQPRLPHVSAAMDFGQSFGAKSPLHVSPPIRQQTSALRHLPMASDGHEVDMKSAGTSSQDSDDTGHGTNDFNRAGSPSENKLPGLGNFSEDIPSGSKDEETGEKESHDMMDHDEDERDHSQHDKAAEEHESIAGHHQMSEHEDFLQSRNFQTMGEPHSNFEQSRQLHRIQTIGGNVPHMRHMPPHGPHSQSFHHGGPGGGRFMGIGPRPPRFGTGGPRGNFPPRNYWQHPGMGPRGFRGQHRPIGPPF